jgi:hypothetical protein
MTHSGTPESPAVTSSRPFITSYDLGYEFSQEHYIALQCMVEDAEEEDSTLAHTPELEEVA